MGAEKVCEGGSRGRMGHVNSKKEREMVNHPGMDGNSIYLLWASL